MSAKRLGRLLMILHMLRRKTLYEKSCEGAGCTKEIVPGQFPLLNYLSKHPNAAQKELASMLMISPAAVAQSTKRLQSAGLLEKRGDPENLRRNRLCITESGQAAVDAFRALVDDVDRQTFEGFSPEEIETAFSLLNRMIDNLSPVEDKELLNVLRSQEDADLPVPPPMHPVCRQHR